MSRLDQHIPKLEIVLELATPDLDAELGGADQLSWTVFCIIYEDQLLCFNVGEHVSDVHAWIKHNKRFRAISKQRCLISYQMQCCV